MARLNGPLILPPGSVWPRPVFNWPQLATDAPCSSSVPAETLTELMTFAAAPGPPALPIHSVLAMTVADALFTLSVPAPLPTGGVGYAVLKPPTTKLFALRVEFWPTLSVALLPTVGAMYVLFASEPQVWVGPRAFDSATVPFWNVKMPPA